ncbi:NAD-dependent epimerase/dehydratase family protein [Desulfobacterota bacterium AH_259_B03_O07]|nr:NAD-dependent epimerase/dehydratase family protein [Desulfobacterota bacterium AH_259_B03_O07]
MKAIVTGGTGFIGSRLVQKLVEKGHEVKCLVRRTSNLELLNKLGVELCYGDLSDPDSLMQVTKGGDVVFHLAAMVSDWGPKDQFSENNVDATRTLLKAANETGVKRFLHMSTSTVIWRSDFWEIHNLEDIDETFPYPENYNDFYNETKAEAEKLVVEFYAETGLETIVFRPSNVWGGGDRVILPRIIMAAKKGILFPMGSGRRWVSPCHVDNLVQALLLAAEIDNKGGNIYFINDGIKIEHMEFLSRLLKAVGIDWSQKLAIPYSLAYTSAYLMELLFKLAKSSKPPVLTRFAVAALAGSRSYSIEKAKKDLGYQPIVNLDDGLKHLGEWVNNIGGLDELLRA